MLNETETAQRYRKHAEIIRAIAEEDGDLKTRRILLGVAANYEHMAQTLDTISRTNESLRRFEARP